MSKESNRSAVLTRKLGNLQESVKSYEYHPVVFFMYVLFPVPLMAIALRDADNVLVTLQIFVIIGAVSSVFYVLLYRVIMKSIGETLLEIAKEMGYKAEVKSND